MPSEEDRVFEKKPNASISNETGLCHTLCLYDEWLLIAVARFINIT